MIDVESQIYTPIAEALRAAFPGIHVSGDYTLAPSSFPHVSIVEQDNYLSLAHADSGDTEKVATLMYQVDVYSNKGSGRKTEARSIMKVIDDLIIGRIAFRKYHHPALLFQSGNCLFEGGHQPIVVVYRNRMGIVKNTHR